LHTQILSSTLQNATNNKDKSKECDGVTSTAPIRARTSKETAEHSTSTHKRVQGTLLIWRERRKVVLEWKHDQDTASDTEIICIKMLGKVLLAIH
jgi:hypothetical protein